MFGSYLLTAWRGILREPFFAAVNVLGLAVGLACCILMLLFVRHETGYDTEYQDVDRLHQVFIVDKEGSESRQVFPVRMLNDLTSAPGGGVEEVAGYGPSHRPLHFTPQAGAAVFTEHYIFAAENFFRMLGRPFIVGNAQDALSRPDSVVITRSLAESLYGTDQVLGRVLTTDRKFQLTIHGVIEDFPVESHIQQRLFISFLARASVMDLSRDLAEIRVHYGLMRLSPAASIESVTARLDSRYQAIPKGWRLQPMGFRIRTRPLPDIHLAGTALQVMGSDGEAVGTLSNQRLVLAATFLAALVLVIAISNFINMTIARSQQRRREIATRKALGAGRTQLITQYLSEALVLTFIAFLLAMALVELMLPGFNVLVDRSLTTAPLFLPDMLGAMLLLVLAVGLVAGLYPAWVLSSLPAVVSQATPARNRLPLRQVLVFGQFFITSLLIVIALTAHRQVELFRQRDFGFDPNVVIASPEFGSLGSFMASQDLRDPDKRWPTIAQRIQAELIGQPAIADVSVVRRVPGGPQEEMLEMVRVGAPAESSVPIGLINHVDEHFLDVFSLPLLSGRGFSLRQAGDLTRLRYIMQPGDPTRVARVQTVGGGILLMASAVQKLKFPTTQSAIGAQLTYGGRAARSLAKREGEHPVFTVIGVTNDMLMGDGLGGMLAGALIFNEDKERNFIIKAERGQELEAAAQTRETFKRLVPGLVVSVESLPDVLDHSLKPVNRLTIGFVGYALLAIVISCLGLYAMTAFVVARRAKEVGIRKVLGASMGQVTGLLGWDLTRPVVFALALALPAGFYIGNYLLQPFADRITIGLSILGLAALISLMVAWATVARQSLRLAASRPHDLLRYE